MTNERDWKVEFDEKFSWQFTDGSVVLPFEKYIGLKSFISTLLTQEREKLIKIAERIIPIMENGEFKDPVRMSGTFSNVFANGYTTALNDLIAEVRKNK